MNIPRRCVGVLGLIAFLAARAAEAPRDLGAPVELPPMLVEESVSSVPWLYVQAGGTEYLSRCAPSTTRQFVEAVLRRQQLMRVLVPDEFVARMDARSVCVLYGQDVQHSLSAEIQRELQAGKAAEAPGRRGDAPGADRINIAPNMRLVDRDLHATIVYIDESLFDSSTLSLAPGHVRYLLKGRVPELPGWLVDGIERAWRGMDFVTAPITLAPLIWNNRGESEALASDPARPRALLPANELFASEAARSAENRHRRRAETRADTQELFVRWALVSGTAMRNALWQFAGRAAEAAVTEEMFEEIFGFDYSELRDRLSDYLSKAVQETKRIEPGPLPPLPEIEPVRATPNQIARVRGEWERLAISHVQKRLPQVREPYIAQARRTLRRAFDAGDRDPRLLATMGLCEIEAGNEAGARQYLELAIAGGVARPRAYYELARIRFAELRRAAPEAKAFSFAELAPVIDPLRRAVTQSPPLPETFILLAQAWACCELAPNADEIAELQRGARLFARRPGVALPIAHALARHGRKPEAVAVLDGCAAYAADAGTQAEMSRLRADLGALAPASAGGR